MLKKSILLLFVLVINLIFIAASENTSLYSNTKIYRYDFEYNGQRVYIEIWATPERIEIEKQKLIQDLNIQNRWVINPTNVRASNVTDFKT